jgi:hypothetical protein
MIPLPAPLLEQRLLPRGKSCSENGISMGIKSHHVKEGGWLPGSLGSTWTLLGIAFSGRMACSWMTHGAPQKLMGLFDSSSTGFSRVFGFSSLRLFVPVSTTLCASASARNQKSAVRPVEICVARSVACCCLLLWTGLWSLRGARTHADGPRRWSFSAGASARAGPPASHPGGGLCV